MLYADNSLPKKYSIIIKIIFSGLCLFSIPVLAAVPQANNDNRTVPLDTPISINVLANDIDTDNDPLTIVAVGGATQGSVEIINNAIRYTPNPGFSGRDSFTYRISDGVDESNDAVVRVNVTNNLFRETAASVNDQSVAQALDAACNSLLSNADNLTRGQVILRARCSELQALAVENPNLAARTINQIAPEETIAIMRTVTANNQSQASAVQNRITTLGQGLNVFSINGIAVAGTEPKGGAAGDLAKKIGVFVSAQLDNTEKQRNTLENGFERDSESLTLGVDYRLSEKAVLGLATGIASASLNYRQQDGKVDSNNTSLITYFTYSHKRWSLDSQLGYGVSNFDIQRQINYLSNGETVQSQTLGATSSDHYFFRTSLQYQWHRNGFSVFPRLDLSYQDNRVKSYTENSASGFTVNLGEQAMSRTSTSLGLQSQYTFKPSWGVFIPLIEILAISDRGSQQDVEGEFAFSPNEGDVFTLEAEQADSFYGSVSVGASLVLPRGINAFVKYDQIVEFEDIESERWSLGFRAEM